MPRWGFALATTWRPFFAALIFALFECSLATSGAGILMP